MRHSEYLEHIARHFRERADDDHFIEMVRCKEKVVGTLALLNLDRTTGILQGLYAPAAPNEPRNPVSMLRSLLLMTLLQFSSIDKWVAETRFIPLYAILCGFEPGDVPGVGTYYDFKKRMIDGPFRKRSDDEIRRSQWNARPHSRNFKNEKEAKKHTLDPNHSKSEILAGKLLKEADSPRGEGFEKILEDLLFQAGIIPSMESGILTEAEKMIVSGDGSIMATAASADGRPQCECRKQGIYKCDHDRLYSSPTAEWCHNHRTDSFIFGDRYYHLIVTINGHDFPLITLMPGGNESDYTLSLKAIDRFVKAAEENGADISLSAFCGDGHHDSYAHYRYLIEKEIDPVIPLCKNSKPISPHLPGRNELRLDEDGTPLCPAGARMRRHQYDRKQKKHVFRCPAKRGTHRNKKPVYVFREDECPLKKDCQPKSSLGPFVYIKSETDPRFYPPLPRESKLYKEIVKQRSASERINFINDSYNIDGASRNADYGLIRLTLANIAHHASVGYAEAKKSGALPDPLSFMENENVPDDSTACAAET